MPEILEVFSRCTSCGINGAKIIKMEKWAYDNGIMFAAHKTGKTQHEASNIRHMEFLKAANLPESLHVAIVVEDVNKVTRLSEWNFS